MKRFKSIKALNLKYAVMATELKNQCTQPDGDEFKKKLLDELERDYKLHLELLNADIAFQKKQHKQKIAVEQKVNTLEFEFEQKQKKIDYRLDKRNKKKLLKAYRKQSRKIFRENLQIDKKSMIEWLIASKDKAVKS